MSGPRSLNPDESRRLQSALRALVTERGSQTAAAASLGVTQQGISSILAGTSPGSYAMARQVARVMGLSVESFLAGELAPLSSPWRSLPGFAAAIAQARALFPRTSPAAWEWVGQLSGPPLPELSPAALGLIAAAYDQTQPGTPRA